MKSIVFTMQTRGIGCSNLWRIWLHSVHSGGITSDEGTRYFVLLLVLKTFLTFFFLSCKKTKDVQTELKINGLLWSPVTHFTPTYQPNDPSPPHTSKSMTLHVAVPVTLSVSRCDWQVKHCQFLTFDPLVEPKMHPEAIWSPTNTQIPWPQLQPAWWPPLHR